MKRFASIFFCVLFGSACRVEKAPVFEAPRKPIVAASTNDAQEGNADAEPEVLPPTNLPALELKALAQNILDKSCNSCHNPTNPQGNFGTIDNVEDMVAGGRYIVPGSPEKSLLFTKLAPTGNMPPSGALKPDEIDVLRRWISSLEQTSNRPLRENDVLALIRRDLEANVAVAQQPSTRYFSLHVPNNLNTSSANLESMRQAFSKVINSLSRSPAIAKPVAIDPQKLVYRLRLEDLAMPRSVFDGVMADFYPWSQAFVPVGEDRTSAEHHTVLRTATGTDHYLVRLDWFVATAPLPQLYSRLLQLGRDQTQLDQQLGVNLLQNVIDNRVLRSGFKNSGVSTQNRMMERHTQANGLAYWISYDFVSNDGLGNLFNVPLGPVGIGQDPKAFHHDGGEIIFQLPNGLFGYYLSTATGQALDKGPLSIVKQNDAPAQFLTAIVNGLSCMSCHGPGLIHKKDEIRPFLQANSTGFNALEINKVFNLYPEDRLLKEAMDRDNALYQRALREAGVDPTKPDPVNQSYRYYNRALTKADVKEELGLNEITITNLLASEPFRSQWTSLQSPGGFIKRDEFNALVGRALDQFKLTVDPIEPLLGDVVINPNCMFADPLQMDNCLVRRPLVPAAPPTALVP